MMKTIILAAGQGTRLRPLTDFCPKCMVEVNGKSIIERQLSVMHNCGIEDKDITIVAGYCSEVLKERLKNTAIQVIVNEEFENTNMVCSLMCAKQVLDTTDDILISYGDIIYEESVLNRILDSKDTAAVIVDDGWYEYWSERCDNPLDDAETLIYDTNDCLVEIGQKTTELGKVQSQYIGLMRFQKEGIKELLSTVEEAQNRTKENKPLWRTTRIYDKMYMTDLLQGMIDEGYRLKAVHINRGWFEIDDCDDLRIVEEQLKHILCP